MAFNGAGNSLLATGRSRNSDIIDGVEHSVVRLHWFDPQPDDTPVDWRAVAPIFATLFLNVYFWLVVADRVPMTCPLPVFALLIAATVLGIAGIFFFGPAFRAHSAKRPVLEIIDECFGAIPAMIVRAGCALYLMVFIARQTAVVFRFLAFNLNRFLSLIETVLVVIGLLIFLSATGLQCLHIRVKQAAFIDKLAIAMLLAACIRVRDSSWAIWHGLPVFGERSNDLSHVWHALLSLVGYAAPLAFLAANFGFRMIRRREVARTALLGISLPLFAIVIAINAIDVAANASEYYRPSLTPNVFVAIWGGDKPSALPGYMTLAAMTIFGAVRFGLNALSECTRARTPGRRWIAAGLLIIPLAGLSVWQNIDLNARLLQFSTACIFGAAAVLTADALMKSPLLIPVASIRWPAAIALLAGIATTLCWRKPVVWWGGDWWEPSLLPVYGVAFGIYVILRLFERPTNLT